MLRFVLTPDEAEEHLLMDVLNSTPLVDGEPTDQLSSPERGREWLRHRGGCGTDAELEAVIRIRTTLQQTIRTGVTPVDGQEFPAEWRTWIISGAAAAGSHSPTEGSHPDTASHNDLGPAGNAQERHPGTAPFLRWGGSPQLRLPAVLVLTYFGIQQTLPGRLKACANVECRRFLLDHSRSGTAKWCQMSTCGNRLKARRHRARRDTMATTRH